MALSDGAACNFSTAMKKTVCRDAKMDQAVSHLHYLPCPEKGSNMSSQTVERLTFRYISAALHSAQLRNQTVFSNFSYELRRCYSQNSSIDVLPPIAPEKEPFLKNYAKRQINLSYPFGEHFHPLHILTPIISDRRGK